MPDLLASLKAALAGRYDIERAVGRGGMAVVFRATDLRYDRPVAIKVLSPETLSGVAAERFLREIRITAQLQHPHILPLLDSGDADGQLYSVMPFVEGETLRDRLVAVGRLPLREALFFAREVADALDHAHRRGVIHRDIKPENILLTDGHAIVADFGIARALGLAGGVSLTGAGIPMGTVAYMSPEQATGDGSGDARSDLYGLGCVLYEMLTGEMAFGGANLREVLTRQVTVTPPSVRTLRPDVPVPVADYVARLLAKKPDDRVQTAGEVAVFLRGALGEPRRISTPDVTWADWQTDEWPAAETAVPPQRDEVVDAPSKWGRWLVAAAVIAALALALAATIVQPSRLAGARDVAPRTDTASVAVLPFDVRGGNAEDAYLGEGIAEEIIARLAEVERLKVTSRTSAAAVKRGGLTIPQIADTLDVRHIVEGSLQRVGERIQARVQLIDAASDATVWQESYQLEEGDVFDLQMAVASRVAQSLVATVAAPHDGIAEPARADRPAAYDAYLEGSYWLERRTAEGMKRAIAAFSRSAELDSAFAPAYAGLASAYTYSVIYGFRGAVDPYTELAQALLLSERAVERDSGLAAAYTARHDARTIAHYPNAVVLPDARRARRLAPNSAMAQMSYAWSLSGTGAVDSALTHAERALALDPLSPGLRHNMIALAIGARRYDAALREASRGRRLLPGDAIAPVLEAFALLLGGRPEECVERELGRWEALRAMCLYSIDREAEAAALADSVAAALGDEQYTVIYEFADLAAYHAWRGDAEGAVRWLQRSAAHSPLLPSWQLASALYDRVRDQPVFQQGLAQVHTLIQDRLRARRAMLGG